MFASDYADYAGWGYDTFYDAWKPCDEKIQLSNGTRYYFVYQDLNSSKCTCQYSDYKDHDLMFSYACAIVSSAFGGKVEGQILTVPDPWSTFHCEMSLSIKTQTKTQDPYDDQVLIYRS